MQTKFQGISVISMVQGQAPEIYVRGSHVTAPASNPAPFGIDVLDLNSTAILQDEKIKTLSEDLEAGKTVSKETVRNRLLEVLNKKPLDFTPLINSPNDANFDKIVKDLFHNILTAVSNTVKNGTLTFRFSSAQRQRRFCIYSPINSINFYFFQGVKNPD